MKNPIAEAYLKMLQEAKEKKMDPVGKADADIDNDGDVDDSDEYLHNRRKAIKKSMKEEVCDKCGKEPCECDDEDEVDESCGKPKKEAVSIDPDDGEVTKSKDDKKKKKEADPETVSEAKFNKGDSVKIKNVKKYDALAKDNEGTVIGMTSGKVMVKVGTGQMNVDPKDLIRESAELTEGKKLRNVLTDREFEKSMKKALADKSNYKGGKVNWNFIDADVYMELSAKGYDLRHPSINYMKRFDALADKLDPENVKESVELEEARILTKTASKEEEKAAQQGYKDGLKRVNRNPYQGTERALQDAYTTGQMVAKAKLKKSVDEAALTVGMKQPVDIDDTEEKGHMDAVKANKAGPGKAKENKAKKLKELRK